MPTRKSGKFGFDDVSRARFDFGKELSEVFADYSEEKYLYAADEGYCADDCRPAGDVVCAENCFENDVDTKNEAEEGDKDSGDRDHSEGNRAERGYSLQSEGEKVGYGKFRGTRHAFFDVEINERRVSFDFGENSAEEEVCFGVFAQVVDGFSRDEPVFRVICLNFRAEEVHEIGRAHV